jgi:hypothetical protein
MKADKRGFKTKVLSALICVDLRPNNVFPQPASGSPETYSTWVVDEASAWKAAGQAVYRDFFVLTGPLTFWVEGAPARWGSVNFPVEHQPVVAD